MDSKFVTNHLGTLTLLNNGTILPMVSFELPEIVRNNNNKITDIYSISAAFVVVTTTLIYIFNNTECITQARSTNYRIINLDNYVFIYGDEMFMYDNTLNKNTIERNSGLFDKLINSVWVKHSGDSMIAKNNNSYYYIREPLETSIYQLTNISINCVMTVTSNENIQLNEQFTYDLKVANIAGVTEVSDGVFVITTTGNKLFLFDEHIFNNNNYTITIDDQSDPSINHSLYMTKLIQQGYIKNNVTYTYPFTTANINTCKKQILVRSTNSVWLFPTEYKECFGSTIFYLNTIVNMNVKIADTITSVSQVAIMTNSFWIRCVSGIYLLDYTAEPLSTYSIDFNKIVFLEFNILSLSTLFNLLNINFNVSSITDIKPFGELLCYNNDQLVPSTIFFSESMLTNIQLVNFIYSVTLINTNIATHPEYDILREYFKQYYRPFCINFLGDVPVDNVWTYHVEESKTYSEIQEISVMNKDVFQYILHTTHEPSDLQLYIRLPNNKGTITININASNTILVIKDDIQNHLGMNPSTYNLYYNDSKLNDDKSLTDYNIMNTFMIDLEFKPMGSLLIEDSNICFPKGTPITTDQGIVAIDNLIPSFHTIRNMKIIAITRTTSHGDKFLVCFPPNSIYHNVPSQTTIISKNHRIFYKGYMLRAELFTNKFSNVTRVDYNGEILYNVLLETYDKMIVNNLICETLHPDNPVSKLYK